MPVKTLSKNFDIFILVIVLFTIPLLISNTYYLNVLILIGIYSIVAMGLNVVVGNAGIFSIAQGSFYGLGAYTSGLISVNFGLNFWLCLLVAILVAGLIGYVIGAISLRIKGHYIAVTTLGFAIIFDRILLEWSSLTGGPGGIGGFPKPSIGDFQFNTDAKYYFLTWAFFLMLFVFNKNVISSRIGRAFEAMKETVSAAQSLGINLAAFKIRAFIISTVFAGIGGSLYAHYATFISPHSFDLRVCLDLLYMLPIGGLGSPWGGVLGGTLIVIFPEILRSIASIPYFPRWAYLTFTDYSFHLIIYSILVILCIFFFPLGLAGLFRGLWYRISYWRKGY
jgi:branched-chain amino acid transport system permease protein